MAKKKKKKVKGSAFQAVQILIFVAVGLVLGTILAYFYYGKLFEAYVKTMHDYIQQDWSKVEYYANRATDQVIELRKMLKHDKVKFKKPMIDNVTDARARLIGADSVAEKAGYLKELEGSLNEVMEFYNKRMDLRNKRFGYIEWGMITKEYIEAYNEYKDRYTDAASEFNYKISRFPFKGAAKKLEYSNFPPADTEGLPDVNLKTEKYHKDDIYRMDKLEGSSNAGSY